MYKPWEVAASSELLFLAIFVLVLLLAHEMNSAAQSDSGAAGNADSREKSVHHRRVIRNAVEVR